MKQITQIFLEGASPTLKLTNNGVTQHFSIYWKDIKKR